MQIRMETANDYRKNENLTREAFWDVYRPGCDEHLVLHRLRDSIHFIPELSLVAEQNGTLIGNIVYAKMLLDGKVSEKIIGFGPLSVLPSMQHKGVGSSLIAASFEKAKALGYKGVLITGSPAYYARFGFVPASRYGIHLNGVPIEEEAPFFMACELEPGWLANHPGVADFAPEYYQTQDIDRFDAQFPPKVKRAPRETDLT